MVRRRDFNSSEQGEGILVLDFFAYWCGPCLQASRDLEHNINRYYESRGVNAYGLPVKVVSINIEAERPEKMETFIQKTGARFVLDDPGGKVFEPLGVRALPYIVVLKSYQESPTLKWGFEYHNSGYTGRDMIRPIIDSISELELDATLVDNDDEKTAVKRVEDWPNGGEGQTLDPVEKASNEIVEAGDRARPDTPVEPVSVGVFERPSLQSGFDIEEQS